MLPFRLWYVLHCPRNNLNALKFILFPKIAFLFLFSKCRERIFFVNLFPCQMCLSQLHGRFDVASLVPLSSPVLALQHVVIPKLLSSKG